MNDKTIFIAISFNDKFGTGAKCGYKPDPTLQINSGFDHNQISDPTLSRQIMPEFAQIQNTFLSY